MNINRTDFFYNLAVKEADHRDPDKWKHVAEEMRRVSARFEAQAKKQFLTARSLRRILKDERRKK